MAVPFVENARVSGITELSMMKKRVARSMTTNPIGKSLVLPNAFMGSVLWVEVRQFSTIAVISQFPHKLLKQLCFCPLQCYYELRHMLLRESVYCF